MPLPSHGRVVSDVPTVAAMGRRGRVLVALGLCVAAATTVASGAVAAPVGGTVPTNWTRHVDPPWTWYAPAGWIAAHGPYDLNISSPTGAKWNKFGFSAATYDATVTPLANAQQWFAGLRNNYLSTARNGPGLYSTALRSARFTSVGAINRIPPTTEYALAWRQRVEFKGRRLDGKRILGEMVMDYAANPPTAFDPFGNAVESFQVRSAPRHGFDASLRTLRTVQRLIFYCGSVC